MINKNFVDNIFLNESELTFFFCIQLNSFKYCYVSQHNRSNMHFRFLHFKGMKS